MNSAARGVQGTVEVQNGQILIVPKESYDDKGPFESVRWYGIRYVISNVRPGIYTLVHDDTASEGQDRVVTTRIDLSTAMKGRNHVTFEKPDVADDPLAIPTPSKNPDVNRTVSEEEYSQVSKRILERIMALREVHPTLGQMTSAAGYEYHVTWVLDDPTKPQSKVNARREVFGKDGYWFSLQFYRGQWGGAAAFFPIEFGDLKLWFQYGHGGNTKEIVAVTKILREENEAFGKKHPWQRPDPSLKATGKPVP